MSGSVRNAVLRPDHNARMRSFMKHFVRVGPGMWTCTRGGEYYGEQGRIQVILGTTVTRGTSLMGVDLAAILEQEFEAQSDNVVPIQAAGRFIPD